MERLGERDLERVLSYLRGLYVRREPADFRRYVLETVPALVASELTTYNELDLRTSENVWEWEPVPPNVAQLTEAFSLHMAENPCVAYFRRTGDGRATMISDFLTQRELRGLGYYSDYLQKMGLEHRMSIVIPKPPHSAVALALGRSGGDFSERDRLVLDLLHPHLAQARDTAEALERLREESLQARNASLSREAFERLGLTSREAEILLDVARGRSNRQIASSLYVSPLTVKTHLQRIYRKLGVGGRAEALSRALQSLDRSG